MYPDLLQALARPRSVFSLATALNTRPGRLWQALEDLTKRKEIHISSWTVHRAGVLAPVYTRGSGKDVAKSKHLTTLLSKEARDKLALKMIGEYRGMTSADLSYEIGVSKSVAVQVTGGLLADGLIVMTKKLGRENFYELYTPYAAKKAEKVQKNCIIVPKRSYKKRLTRTEIREGINTAALTEATNSWLPDLIG